MIADAPGPLLATGRDADVYDLGDGRVLRRYRKDYDTAAEAATMGHVAAHGYPVPAVHDADGTDLVMDRVDGPTMLDHLGRRPWLLRRHARALADLQRRLADVPIGDLDLTVRSDGPGVLTHGDLHPANVLMGSSGPVVIDWTGAHLGPPGFDTAVTWALLHAADAPMAGRVGRMVATAGRGLFLRAFLAASDRETAEAALPVAVEARQRDLNLSNAERRRMSELLR